MNYLFGNKDIDSAKILMEGKLDGNFSIADSLASCI